MGKLTFHETPAPEYNMCNEKNPFSAVVRKRDIFLGLLFCKQELLFQKKLDELPTNVQYPNKNIYIDVFHELRETYFYDYKLQELEKNEKHFIKTSYDEDLTQYENTGIFIPLFYYFFKKIKLVEWIDENLSIHDAYLSLNKDKFFMNDKINSDFLDGALNTINNRIEHYKLVHDDVKGLREYELIEQTKTQEKKKYHTNSNEKTTNKQRRIKQCYECYDIVKKQNQNLKDSEIKKEIAKRMRITVKTVNLYLNHPCPK